LYPLENILHDASSPRRAPHGNGVVAAMLRALADLN